MSLSLAWGKLSSDLKAIVLLSKTVSGLGRKEGFCCGGGLSYKEAGMALISCSDVHTASAGRWAIILLR